MKAEWTNKDSLTSSETTKAIVVIDMPESCLRCLYCGYKEENEVERVCLFMSQAYVLEGNLKERNAFCPLRPLPEKLVPFGYIDVGNEDGLYEKGYNACIDEITGETE